MNAGPSSRGERRRADGAFRVIGRGWQDWTKQSGTLDFQSNLTLCPSILPNDFLERQWHILQSYLKYTPYG